MQELVEATQLTFHNLPIDNGNVVLNSITVSTNGICLDATELSKAQCGTRFKTDAVRAVCFPQLSNIVGSLPTFECRDIRHTGHGLSTLYLLGLYLVGRPYRRSVLLSDSLLSTVAIVRQFKRTVTLRKYYTKLVNLLTKLIDLSFKSALWNFSRR